MLKIILLCMAAVMIYGNCHDQVTARVCVEYFTVGHNNPFPTESPTLLALGFGSLATWWVGLIFGVLAAIVCRAGSWPKLMARVLVRPIGCLLIVMAIAALLAGLTGFQLARATNLVLPAPIGPRIPQGHHHAFFADTLAHLAAYVVGILAGLIVCARILLERYRSARSSTRDTSRAVSSREHGLAVVSRWTARTISIPLVVLLAILTFGDHIPNPLDFGSREWLYAAVDLTVLIGLLTALRRENLGGILILAGLLVFVAAREYYLLRIVLAPWLVTGTLYLLCWIERPSDGNRQNGTESAIASSHK